MIYSYLLHFYFIEDFLFQVLKYFIHIIYSIIYSTFIPHILPEKYISKIFIHVYSQFITYVHEIYSTFTSPNHTNSEYNTCNTETIIFLYTFLKDFFWSHWYTYTSLTQ